MEKVWMWIAWRLPKELVKWCFCRMFAHATQDKYGGQVVGTVTCFEAMDRWDK